MFRCIHDKERLRVEKLLTEKLSKRKLKFNSKKILIYLWHDNSYPSRVFLDSESIKLSFIVIYTYMTTKDQQKQTKNACQLIERNRKELSLHAFAIHSFISAFIYGMKIAHNGNLKFT